MSAVCSDCGDACEIRQTHERETGAFWIVSACCGGDVEDRETGEPYRADYGEGIGPEPWADEDRMMDDRGETDG